MPIYSRTITVKGDIESAFNFVADFRNLDQWDTASTAELITNEPIRETRQNRMEQNRTEYIRTEQNQNRTEITGHRRT